MPPLKPDHIAVSNVRPAYEASLARGVSARELEALGLPQQVLDDDEGSVSGSATYAHMERMARRSDLGPFMVDAVRRHTLASLGIVGLSCKTLPTVGEAFRCHGRFQHLTNRTASYTQEVQGDDLHLVEHRWGPARDGSLILSDYALLVAVHLLRSVAAEPIVVREAHSRRAELDPSQRAVLEDFLGAPIRLGHERAALVLSARTLVAPVSSADPELAAYFRGVLSRAAPFADEASELVARVRVALQDAFATGTPTGVDVGRRLGMSQRTLQRRLRAEGTPFSALVSDTRMRLAEGYLADPDLTIAEVAYLLGYREVTSFFRSFRRWKGVSPTAWRSSPRRSETAREPPSSATGAADRRRGS